MRARTALSAALAAALLLSGCTGGPAKPAADPSEAALLGPGEDAYKARQKQAADLLTERGKAVLAKDEAAWLRPVEAARNVTVADEKMRFANFQLMQPQKFSLVMNYVDDMGQPAGSAYPKGATTLKSRVHAVVQYAADVALNVQDYDYTFLRVGTRLSIVDVEPVPAAEDTYTTPTVNAPWDTVALKGARTGNVSILAPADSTWNPADYTGIAQQADQFVRGLWGGRPAPAGFMVFLARGADKDVWFLKQPDPTLKAASGYVLNPTISGEDGSPRMIVPKLGGGLPTESMAGSRIVLDMDRLKTTQDVYRVLVHEMAHAIGPHLMPRTTFLDSSPSGILNAPTWAIEGFAEWAEIGVAKNAADRSRFVKANRKRYGLTGDLPPNTGFYSADSSRTSFHYQVAAMMFVAVEKVGGKAKAVRFYELVVTTPNFVADTPMFLDPTLREAGVDPAQVWRQFRALTR